MTLDARTADLVETLEALCTANKRLSERAGQLKALAGPLAETDLGSGA